MKPEKVTTEWAVTGDKSGPQESRDYAPERVSMAAWVTYNSADEIVVRFFESDPYGWINSVRGLLVLQRAITTELARITDMVEVWEKEQKHETF